jgi:hypothetical protein
VLAVVFLLFWQAWSLGAHEMVHLKPEGRL